MRKTRTVKTVREAAYLMIQDHIELAVKEAERFFTHEDRVMQTLLRARRDIQVWKTEEAQ